jgi:Protein of unknown function (DUF3224)
MPIQLSATFEVKSWDENPFDDLETPKLTRAVVSKTYAGDIDGSSTTEWLMAYAEDGDATFVGLERFTGEIDGRSGTLVLRHVGSYADGAAKADLTVVEGANSGELGSASREGAFLADPAGSVSLVLSFD